MNKLLSNTYIRLLVFLHYMLSSCLKYEHHMRSRSDNSASLKPDVVRREFVFANKEIVVNKDIVDSKQKDNKENKHKFVLPSVPFFCNNFKYKNLKAEIVNIKSKYLEEGKLPIIWNNTVNHCAAFLQKSRTSHTWKKILLSSKYKFIDNTFITYTEILSLIIGVRLYSKTVIATQYRAVYWKNNKFNEFYWLDYYLRLFVKMFSQYISLKKLDGKIFYFGLMYCLRPDLNLNSQYTFHGPVSTTDMIGVAKNFAYEGIIIKFTVKNNCTYLPVNISDMSYFPNENEYLIFDLKMNVLEMYIAKELTYKKMEEEEKITKNQPKKMLLNDNKQIIESHINKACIDNVKNYLLN